MAALAIGIGCERGGIDNRGALDIDRRDTALSDASGPGRCRVGWIVIIAVGAVATASIGGRRNIAAGQRAAEQVNRRRAADSHARNSGVKATASRRRYRQSANRDRAARLRKACSAAAPGTRHAAAKAVGADIQFGGGEAAALHIKGRSAADGTGGAVPGVNAFRKALRVTDGVEEQIVERHAAGAGGAVAYPDQDRPTDSRFERRRPLAKIAARHAGRRKADKIGHGNRAAVGDHLDRTAGSEDVIRRCATGCRCRKIVEAAAVRCADRAIVGCQQVDRPAVDGAPVGVGIGPLGADVDEKGSRGDRSAIGGQVDIAAQRGSRGQRSRRHEIAACCIDVHTAIGRKQAAGGRTDDDVAARAAADAVADTGQAADVDRRVAVVDDSAAIRDGDRDGAANAIARARGQIAGRQRAAAAGEGGEHQVVHIHRDAAIDRQADRAAGAIGASCALDTAAAAADAIGGQRSRAKVNGCRGVGVDFDRCATTRSSAAILGGYGGHRLRNAGPANAIGADAGSQRIDCGSRAGHADPRGPACPAARLDVAGLAGTRRCHADKSVHRKRAAVFDGQRRVAAGTIAAVVDRSPHAAGIKGDAAADARRLNVQPVGGERAAGAGNQNGGVAANAVAAIAAGSDVPGADRRDGDGSRRD